MESAAQTAPGVSSPWMVNIGSGMAADGAPALLETVMEDPPPGRFNLIVGRETAAASGAASASAAWPGENVVGAEADTRTVGRVPIRIVRGWTAGAVARGILPVSSSVVRRL